ncbi:MAG TPA: FtsW/RodA/SpoVE family cell cycle protein [Bryobacteraceae bacterium]|nr:FtsW/RodA/SpoVE family cell cycle protein [Bryobacteraceae bacterium]
MPLTRSTAAERPRFRTAAGTRPVWRFHELLWGLAAALLIGAGLWLVYRAKTQDSSTIDQGLQAKQLLNLNELGAREDLLPVLAKFYPDPAEREFVARKIYYISGGLANFGAIGRIRVAADEVGRGRGLKAFRDRMGNRESVALVTGDQLRLLKPNFVVRRPEQFRRTFVLWTALFFAAFLLVNVWLSIAGSRADQTLLPAVLLLAGIGFILMVSLRDPVRDNLLFADFAQGAALGCLLLAAAAQIDYEKLFGNLSFVPLLASFAISALLILFGSGPGTSDAKVNLFGFQPVEIIRLLLVFFLAGYFARRWDVLRHARETRPSVAALTRLVDIPPLEYTVPAVACVALSIVFFFLQKDMGPALVFACLFLSLYGIARGSAFVPLVGLALVALGFVAGYFIGIPHTVGERVSMWLSPWDNLVHGGDQLAHSLWAFATGGTSGMGIGLGDPQLVPAAHTDLILSALGEEWGFLGVAAVFALYALIVYKALRIGLRACSDYEFFLAAGLAAATALQILLISGGALGVLPLSGVVTPFLSYGRTALLTNFAVIGILLSISRHAPAQEVSPFRRQAAAAGLVFAFAGAVVLAKAGYVQVARSAAIMGQGTLVVQADGARRYQYNPRFQAVMREIPMGSIYDRNGLPLATSDWQELEKHRAEYQQLGIDIDRACPRNETRHYPLGGLAFDLLGDLRTRIRWAASNTSFVERDSSRRLRGYDERPTLVEVKNPKTGAMERVVRYDYRELVPLARHRYDPQNPAVRRVLDRARDVHMSVDARLQVRVAEILQKQLQQAGVARGAAVVLDPANGDLLAAISLPAPDLNVTLTGGTIAGVTDRARYGLYPPGSTFKVVTAMAALRKDPQLAHKTYQCIRLPDGRVGNYIKGSKRPIRDDVQDKEPHGTLDMERGIVVSCNAYFAQLGTYDVGADPLLATASLLGISVATPATASELRKSLPQSSYGQGQVVASPFQMARVAATVATGGGMPQGRWVTDETNTRTNAPENVLPPDVAGTLGRFMREVVTSGTGRRAASAAAPIAGKTGTAELADAPSHAWFIGFAPYGGSPRKIAFSVLVENGIYGGTAAAPAAAEIVNTAVKLGLIQ